MVHRYKIPLSLHRHLDQSLHQVVLHRPLAVNLPHLDQSLHRAVNLLLVQHKMLLITPQALRQQINLLLKVVVASPKQVKLRQIAIVVKAHHLHQCH
jgi:hypothetical protein